MLTVRYDSLRLEPGDRVLDLGCGGGRHAFEAARLGAKVIALDADLSELKQVRDLFSAMESAGELEARGVGAATCANALALPFPDGAFDGVIAAEVMEHISNDEAALAELARVLRPGGVMAVTVPAWLPERMCWALSEQYHAPFVVGGHVRIYTRRQLRQSLIRAGLTTGGSHKAHALHSPYWWLRCAVGPSNESHLLVRWYHRFLVWDIVKRPRLVSRIERWLNPVLGKSLVIYAIRPQPAARTER